jgi:hypothetical protein
VAVIVPVGSMVRLGFNVRVGRGVKLGLRPINLAVLVGWGKRVGVVVSWTWTGVLLAQALNNNEDSTAAMVSSLKLCFIFILPILLCSITGINS